MQTTIYILLALSTVAAGETFDGNVRKLFTGKFFAPISQGNTLIEMRGRHGQLVGFQNKMSDSTYVQPSPIGNVLFQGYMSIFDVDLQEPAIMCYCLYVNGRFSYNTNAKIPNFREYQMMGLANIFEISIPDLEYTLLKAVRHFKSYIGKHGAATSGYLEADLEYCLFVAGKVAYVMVTLVLIQ